MGLEVKWMLGLLTMAKTRSVIDAVGPLIDLLVVHDFWMTDELHQRLLAEVGE